MLGFSPIGLGHTNSIVIVIKISPNFLIILFTFPYYSLFSLSRSPNIIIQYTLYITMHDPLQYTPTIHHSSTFVCVFVFISLWEESLIKPLKVTVSHNRWKTNVWMSSYVNIPHRPELVIGWGKSFVTTNHIKAPSCRPDF